MKGKHAVSLHRMSQRPKQPDLAILNKKIANSNKAICDIRLMATIYFLGPSPRRNSLF